MFEFTQHIFFWTLINFIVLLALIHKVALPSFYKMVEENQAKKEKAMADLEHNRQESAALLESYQKKISEARDEAQGILDEAKRERELLKKAEFEKLHAEKQVLLSSIHSELEMERQKFVSEMKEQAADLILLTTKKIIGRSLTKEDHLSLIQENVNDFEKLVKC